MGRIFSNGYIRELELVAYEPADANRLAHFILEGN
jgi:hypothetical protein